MELGFRPVFTHSFITIGSGWLVGGMVLGG
jgi:hypothetical protein